MSLDKTAPKYYEFTNLWQGLNWSGPPDSLKPGELLDAKNMNITKNGLITRNGLESDEEATIGNPIIGMQEYTTVAGSRYILYRCGDKMRQKTWDGSSLGTVANVYTNFTSGTMTYMAPFNGAVYCTNGTDDNVKIVDDLIKGNVLTGTTNVGMSPPVNLPTVARQADNYDGIRGKYKYKYVYLHDREAIKVYCDASDATDATIKKSGNTITLKIVGGTAAGTVTKDVTAAANDTLTELDTVIEGTSGWASALYALGTIDSSLLYDFDEVSCLGEDNEYAMEIKDIPLTRSNPSPFSDEYTAGKSYRGIAASSGDGSTTHFTDALTLDTSPDESVQKDSAKVYYVIGGQEYIGVAVDNGDGTTANWEGEYIESNPDGNTSTLTYDTGAIDMYFLTAPDNNTDIYYDYETSETVRVTVTSNISAQWANKIEIYRTMDLFGDDVDSTIYFKVGEVLNPGDTNTATYDDTADNLEDLGMLMEENNTKPPKATFCRLHKNRMFYMNCPDERDGDSLIMFSKPFDAEACPTSNYQYISRGDSYEITGGASFGDYFVVFKRDKFAVIEGDFEAMYYVSAGIGCIAPRSIVEFKDRVIFLSEYGWYSFDGVNLLPVSAKINDGINNAGFFEGDKHLSEYTGSTVEHFAFYYPELEQYVSWINDTGKSYNFAAVGHFLEAILGEEQISETAKQGLMGWTYHSYDKHYASTNTDIRCAAKVQYNDGTYKIWLGGDDGYVYYYDSATGVDELDSAYGVSTYALTQRISTGWDALGTPKSVVKTARALNVSYGSTASFSTTCTLKSYVDKIAGTSDYSNVDSITISGGSDVLSGALYPGDMWSSTWQMFSENYRSKGSGQEFMFVISNTTKSARLLLTSIGVWFRVEGVRTWSPTRS